LALFRFFMIGTSEGSMLNVEANSLRELAATISQQKFLEAEAVDPDGCCMSLGVLVPTNRIQFITEVGM
jgi:anti-sigma-K factor RskA